MPLTLERDEEWHDPDEPPPRTQFYRDNSETITPCKDSPDIGFRASVNPYRGCEQGCIYCYARPTHEYLGFSTGLDFETKIMVKLDAPNLLRRELAASRWQPQVVAVSGVTDCYQPVERRLILTCGCLDVLAEFRNPVGLITKNHLVTRDVDLLAEPAQHQAVVVFISLTTLDTELRKIMEPRTSPPAVRLNAITTLAQAGVPVGVLVAPEIPALLAAAANHHSFRPKLSADRRGGRWSCVKQIESLENKNRICASKSHDEKNPDLFPRRLGRACGCGGTHLAHRLAQGPGAG